MAALLLLLPAVIHRGNVQCAFWLVCVGVSLVGKGVSLLQASSCVLHMCRTVRVLFCLASC